MTEFPQNQPSQSKRPLRIYHMLIGMILLYGALAYLILPLVWHTYEKRHPDLADAADITHTASGIPGDPINIALIGTEADLLRAMIAAKWHPADPITLKSSIEIGIGVVFDRPYQDAPVSPLYYYGRKEDFAYELQVGEDPKKRHHVRYWKSPKVDDQGRPMWMGAATFDTHVGLSHTTGQITHHIAADVDADRDLVINDIKKAGYLAKLEWIDGFHKQLSGKNGGGDPWHTDGRLAVGTLGSKSSLQN